MESELRRHVPGYEPLAFAPPFGACDPEVTRLQLDRTMSGGELHSWLETA